MLEWLSTDKMFKSFYYLSYLHFIALFLSSMLILPNLNYSNITEYQAHKKTLTYPSAFEIRQSKID